MTTYYEWRFRFGIAIALYVGFLFGGLAGAAGDLLWMAGSSILAVVAILVVVLWFRSIVTP